MKYLLVVAMWIAVFWMGCSRGTTAAPTVVTPHAPATSTALDASTGTPPDAATAVNEPREPDRMQCTRDEECVVAPYPIGANRCCTGFAEPHTRAWDEWLHGWMRRHCPQGQRFCRPEEERPAPALPAPCYFVARCRAGRCASDCGS